MKQYLDLINYIINNGEDKPDRTNTGTKSIFGYQMRFNLQEGFPLITTKKIFTKSLIHELLFFLKGKNSTEYLKKNKVKIWEPWTSNNSIRTDVQRPMDKMANKREQIYRSNTKCS